jgi:hypothetical protein
MGKTWVITENSSPNLIVISSLNKQFSKRFINFLTLENDLFAIFDSFFGHNSKKYKKMLISIFDQSLSSNV